MGLRQDIKKAKEKLIEKAKENGIYENFGEAEIMKLSDKYIDLSDYSDKMNENRRLIEDFYEWCMRYDGA